MKNGAITDPIAISGIYRVLEQVDKHSSPAYVFFSLVFVYGLKQRDLFCSRVCDIFSSNISGKYSDLDLSNCDLIEKLPKHCYNLSFLELLPTRDALFKLLKKSANEVGFNKILNVSVLQKTWAYCALMSGQSVSVVMSHFSYKNSVYRFLSDFLGLSFSDCLISNELINLYSRACFSEVSHLNYSCFPESKQLEFLSLLHRILDLLGSLE